MGNNHRTKFVGMDVHQKSISIALADEGPDGDVRLYGTIKNTPEAIDKLSSSHRQRVYLHRGGTVHGSQEEWRPD